MRYNKTCTHEHARTSSLQCHTFNEQNELTARRSVVVSPRNSIIIVIRAHDHRTFSPRKHESDSKAAGAHTTKTVRTTLSSDVFLKTFPLGDHPSTSFPWRFASLVFYFRDITSAFAYLPVGISRGLPTDNRSCRKTIFTLGRYNIIYSHNQQNMRVRFIYTYILFASHSVRHLKLSYVCCRL